MRESNKLYQGYLTFVLGNHRQKISRFCVIVNYKRKRRRFKMSTSCKWETAV